MSTEENMSKRETIEKLQTTKMVFNPKLGLFEFKLDGGQTGRKYAPNHFVFIQAKVNDDGLIQGSAMSIKGRNHFKLSFEQFISEMAVVK